MSEQKEPRTFFAHLYNDDFETVFGKHPEEKKPKEENQHTLITAKQLDDIVTEWRKDVKKQAGADTMQVGGDHYKVHGIQPWDIIQQYDLNFFAGNIVKYILRYQFKNGLEDLQKAEHYIKKLIELEKDKN